jgi:hypothetical protein
MNRLTRSTVLFASLVIAAAACGKKADDKTGTATGTGTGTGTGTAAPATTPDAAAPPPTPDAAVGAVANVPLAGALTGPHASVEAYCATVSAAFVKDDCFSQADQIEMCSCEAADKDDLAGNTKAGGKATHLAGATLVVVADNSADYTHCSLALQLAGGWHVVHKAFACGAAPVSHDGGLATTVNGFNIVDEALTLDYTVDDGKGKKPYRIACKATAADKVECAAPAAR